MAKIHINIIGAGIGGLATALALLRAGHQVKVYEQSASLGEVGAGLTLSPNANHALNYLGLKNELATFGGRPKTAGVQHYQSGDLLVDVSRDLNPRASYGADYLMAHRADLHQALIAAITKIDNKCLYLDHSLVGYKKLRKSSHRSIRQWP